MRSKGTYVNKVVTFQVRVSAIYVYLYLRISSNYGILRACCVIIIYRNRRNGVAKLG